MVIDLIALIDLAASFGIVMKGLRGGVGGGIFAVALLSSLISLVGPMQITSCANLVVIVSGWSIPIFGAILEDGVGVGVRLGGGGSCWFELLIDEFKLGV